MVDKSILWRQLHNFIDEEDSQVYLPSYQPQIFGKKPPMGWILIVILGHVLSNLY